jgi:hypothetical protein
MWHVVCPFGLQKWDDDNAGSRGSSAVIFCVAYLIAIPLLGGLNSVSLSNWGAQHKGMSH